MKNRNSSRLRQFYKTVLLGIEVVLGLFEGLCIFCLPSSASTWKRRSIWLQRHAQAFSRILNLNVRVYGEIPRSGLVVANHLGYLDILVLGSVMPCAFVAKKEVRSWPAFGWLASLGGTLFVDRTRRQDLPNALKQMCSALDRQLPLILFPEGTSSGGETVLPFRSSLFDAVTSLYTRITPAAIQYSMTDGSVAEEACYWKDMTLVPHLWNLLGKKQISASIHFGTPQFTPAPRKRLAHKLHQSVVNLRGTQSSHNLVSA